MYILVTPLMYGKMMAGVIKVYVQRVPEEIFRLANFAVSVRFGLFDNLVNPTLLKRGWVKTSIKRVALETGVSEKQLHFWKNLLAKNGPKLFSHLKPGRRTEDISTLKKDEKLLIYETVNNLLVDEKSSEGKNRIFSPGVKEKILKQRDRLKEQFCLGYETFSNLLGIDSGSIRLWSRREKEEGVEGLKDKSRAPKHSPRKLPEELINRIVAYGQRWKSWHRGRIKITEFAATFRWKHRHLLIRQGKTNLADKTIARYLKEAGLYQEKQQRPEAKRGAFRYYFPGAQLLIDTTALTFSGIKVKLISVMDAASRAIFHQQAFSKENAEAVLKSLKGSLKKAGRLGLKILSVVSDHGRSYKARRVWEYIKAEGSMRIFSAPYWPQGKAALERYFRTAKEAISNRKAVLFFLITGILLWIKERILLICLNLVLIGFNGKYQLTPNAGIDGKSPAQRLSRQPASPAYQEAATRLLEERERKSQLKAELITSLHKEFGLGLPLLKVKKHLLRYHKESITEAAQALRRKLVGMELPPLNRWYYLSKVTDIVEQKRKAAELLHAEQVIEDEKIAAIKREERQRIEEEQRWHQTHPEQALEEAVEWRLALHNNEFAHSHYESEISNTLKKVLMRHSFLTAGLKVDKICKRIQEKHLIENEKIKKAGYLLPEPAKLKKAKEKIITLIRQSYAEAKQELPALQNLRQLWRKGKSV